MIEKISEDVELKQKVRDYYFNKAYIRSAKGKKSTEHSKFEPYFQFHELVKNLMNPQNSHRYMAIRRGWTEEELVVDFGSK